MDTQILLDHAQNQGMNDFAFNDSEIISLAIEINEEMYLPLLNAFNKGWNIKHGFIKD